MRFGCTARFARTNGCFTSRTARALAARVGDLESATDYLAALDKAGYADVTGFNLDGSHMEWQGVSVVQLIREFGARIHCAHIKGVQVIREHTRAGLLGGHRPMGHRLNGWNFVTAGTARDANSVEEIMIELNRVGFDGAVMSFVEYLYELAK